MEALRTISDLYLYPVKSCRGIRVKEAVLGPYGLQYDRRWIVTRYDGTVPTPQELPKLACVVPKMDAAGLTLLWNFDEAPILIPKNHWEAGVRSLIATREDTIQAIDQGDEAAAWLSRFLKQSVRLVYLPDTALRAISNATDGIQNSLIFVSNESLTELNHRLERSIGITRFRPTVVTVGSAKPFEEDEWIEFSIKTPSADILCRSVKPCIRCIVITTHPVTGERQQKEPLQVLSHIHKDGPHPLFGMHVNPLSEGTLHIGDTIDIIRFGPRPSL